MKNKDDRPWILVTGAAGNLNPDERNTAKQIGSMLAMEGYGLIIGDWPGVDTLVATAFLEACDSETHPRRITHVANHGDPPPHRVRGADVLPDSGDDPDYSSDAVRAADAGIIISGRRGSKPTMDALLRLGKPVLPLPFLGWDAFDLFREILRNWGERPVKGLTELQFLELVRPWSYGARTVARLLRASLTTEPYIFISYRRNDVPAAAGRIFDGLVHYYGEAAVFIDYEGFSVGDKVKNLLSRVRDCSALIVVIGPDWNLERLQDQSDYVRREIETANDARTQIIPVLVQRTGPPAIIELPESLQFLLGRNFEEVRMSSWSESMRRLGKAIDDAIVRHFAEKLQNLSALQRY